MSLLNKIADYVREWDGNEENVPKMEINMEDLREIASMNVDRCKTKEEVKALQGKFITGKKVVYEGDDESDDILCPYCLHDVARNDDYEEMRPAHCPECGAKLIY